MVKEGMKINTFRKSKSRREEPNRRTMNNEGGSRRCIENEEENQL